jgi:hypothetical protein
MTGTPVKEITETDRGCLGAILADDQRLLRSSQFNELLLLVNKDRVSDGFFRYFFGDDCRVGTLPEGIRLFQTKAMLCFGNFIYAFRQLGQMESIEEFRRDLGEFGLTGDEAMERFTGRCDKLLDIQQIARDDTPLVGYLSATEILAELERAEFLREQLPPTDQIAGIDWSAYEARLIAAAGPQEHRPLRAILDRYRVRNPDQRVTAFADFLADAAGRLRQRHTRAREVRAVATRNQDIYLTWDHMDVYFATSMRKRWEYEDLFDFVQALMGHEELADLRLRYFDPTQAFTDNRVNKGLVESLMLKRARCTIYSVQDTDTLGKDSELAATLAQGKPVIAYVPRIEVEQRNRTLLAEDPGTILDRLRFVLYADDAFAGSLEPDDLAFMGDFRELEVYEGRRVWRSIPDTKLIEQLRRMQGAGLERLCRIIALSEARIYDRRARTLQKSHPLAIQVNLGTGVANGVLVVRTVEDCARLLRCVLTNTMEFNLIDSTQDRMWYLTERISQCPYRAVSKDRKLTNCFWNFYRKPTTTQR